MTDHNVIGFMCSSQEDYVRMTQLVGSIYATMNVVKQPENNHVVGIVDTQLTAYVESQTNKNPSFFK